MRRRTKLSLAAAIAIAIAGCGGGIVKANETCQTVGSTEGCNSGAICGEDQGVRMCLLICDADEDCATVEVCAPVSNTSTKACQTTSNVPA